MREILMAAALLSFICAPAEAANKPIWGLVSVPGGDQFLTNSCDEANTTQAPNHYYLLGLRFWLSDQQLPDAVPFYRFFNGPAGRHFYTTSSNAEGAPNYQMEGGGPMGYIFTGPAPDRAHLYHLFHNQFGIHVFVVTDNDKELYQISGYAFQGTVGYVLTSGPTCTVTRNWVPEGRSGSPPPCAFEEDNCGLNPPPH